MQIINRVGSMANQGYVRQKRRYGREIYLRIEPVKGKELIKSKDDAPPINGEQISRYITKIRREKLLASS